MLGVKPPCKIGVGARVTELRRQIPLALLFERQRSFKRLRLQPVLPRPKIVGIGAVDRVAKQEHQLDPWQHARYSLSHFGRLQVIGALFAKDPADRECIEPFCRIIIHAALPQLIDQEEFGFRRHRLGHCEPRMALGEHVEPSRTRARRPGDDEFREATQGFRHGAFGDPRRVAGCGAPNRQRPCPLR